MKRATIVTVRPRTPADDGFIVNLARPSFAKYSLAPARSVAVMMNSSAAITLVAESRGRLLGFAIVSFTALSYDFGSWTQPILASLDAIAVHEDAQRLGVGKALMMEVERVARREKAVSIRLRTAVENRRAQALFRRAGFQTAALLPAFYRGGQKALAMMKALDV